MGYLQNIITADAACSTADKGYAPFGPGTQECYATVISATKGRGRVQLHPTEYQRLKALGVFDNGTTEGWFICTNGIKNSLVGLASFASGFEPTKLVGGVLQTQPQVTASTSSLSVYVSGVLKGLGSTAFDIPACFCKCPVTNCCPTETHTDGKGQTTNDWLLTCDQNRNGYSPLRSGCF